MIESCFRILALIRKELLAIFKDPKSRFILVAAAYPAVPDLRLCRDLRPQQCALRRCSTRTTARPRALVAQLDGSGVFHRVATLDRPGEIATFINDQRALLVVVIDQDFERQADRPAQAAVQVIADGRNSNTAGTAQGYVGTIVDRLRRANGDSRKGMRPADPGDDARLVQSQPRDALEHDPALIGTSP